MAYRIRGQELDLYSAYVPEVHRGRGYASQLILHSIHFAVLHGLRVKANSPTAKHISGVIGMALYPDGY
ncbi:MAG: N-acetyltransferase [Bacteroidales bacterium]|nr:N-acetyltransferase [Bacteroidales bacterium]